VARPARNPDAPTIADDPRDQRDRAGGVVPLPGRGRALGRVVTGQETRIEAVRQWSGLLAEQTSGWGSLVGGILGLADPQIAPVFVSAHPIEFCMAGAGILSGKKLAAILKAALSAT